jgi:hypothetical protein
LIYHFSHDAFVVAEVAREFCQGLPPRFQKLVLVIAPPPPPSPSSPLLFCSPSPLFVILCAFHAYLSSVMTLSSAAVCYRASARAMGRPVRMLYFLQCQSVTSCCEGTMEAAMRIYMRCGTKTPVMTLLVST